jgi:hypothetical protein
LLGISSSFEDEAENPLSRQILGRLNDKVVTTSEQSSAYYLSTYRQCLVRYAFTIREVASQYMKQLLDTLHKSVQKESLESALLLRTVSIIEAIAVEISGINKYSTHDDSSNSNANDLFQENLNILQEYVASRKDVILNANQDAIRREDGFAVELLKRCKNLMQKALFEFFDQYKDANGLRYYALHIVFNNIHQPNINNFTLCAYNTAKQSKILSRLLTYHIRIVIRVPR